MSQTPPESNNSTIDDAVAFVLKNPWLVKYPKELVRRFLGELVSSSKLIYKWRDQQGRLALAVLIDQIHNPSNDASLEILAAEPDMDPVSLVLAFIQMAIKDPPLGRSGFQVNVPADGPISDELLSARGFVHYYDTYEMLVSVLPENDFIDAFEVRRAMPSDVDALFDLLCEAFAQNPEANIPAEKLWKAEFLKSVHRRCYLWDEFGKPIGFLLLSLDDNQSASEISLLGVHPTARGRGVGQKLLMHGLREAKREGYHQCHLTVSATNAKAIGIYQRAGFEVKDHFKVFRRNF